MVLVSQPVICVTRRSLSGHVSLILVDERGLSHSPPVGSQFCERIHAYNGSGIGAEQDAILVGYQRAVCGMSGGRPESSHGTMKICGVMPGQQQGDPDLHRMHACGAAVLVASRSRQLTLAL